MEKIVQYYLYYVVYVVVCDVVCDVVYVYLRGVETHTFKKIFHLLFP